MKRISAVLVTVVMVLALLTGCGNAVFDDFENFLNVEMTDVNANYDKIKSEVAAWENLDDTAALISSLNDTLLPLVNDSLDKMGKINPETEEVKELKTKYIAVMDAYKGGFEEILTGLENEDEAKMTSGAEKLEQGVALLDEYNAALEALAKEVGAEIEY